MSGEATLFSLHFDPIIPVLYLYGLCGITALLSLISVIKSTKYLWLRVLVCSVFLFILSGPSVISEERENVQDIAIIIVDESPSQRISGRLEQTEEILENLLDRAESIPDLDIRVVRQSSTGAFDDTQTRLFTKLEETLFTVPASQRAGVIFISDGHIHDIPETIEGDNYGPIHLLLTGTGQERDRQIVVEQAPAYGIVGQNISISVRIEDISDSAPGFVPLTITENDQNVRTVAVPVGEIYEFEVPVSNAGQNIYVLETPAVDGEITDINNKSILVVNGVRDRLKVLLVSGQPHAGGRAWRDFLTSDPGVDLVHFTILREPSKLDNTPQNELSLIAFPFQELFEIKLYDFDLIIFDRYKLNRILPTYYFSNIAKYVEEGGALLEVSGPSYARDSSIFNTALGNILPGAPSGDIFETEYYPKLTAIGKQHPVTEGIYNPNAQWGPWLRQVGFSSTQGRIIMEGYNEKPLLVLNTVGEGRIAHMASDHIWLWSRGYQGGGPQNILLRRLAHWLMKEPDLDENALSAHIERNVLNIRRKALEGLSLDVRITKPDGAIDTLNLTRNTLADDLRGTFAIDQYGVYSVSDGTQTEFAIVGDLNSPEMQDIVPTAEKMDTVIDVSKGSMKQISESGVPDIRLIPENRKYSGRNWIGLRQNNDYTVNNLKTSPLVSIAFSIMGLVILITSLWWFEGRKYTS